MNSITSTGLICIKNDLNIEFVVCKIDYILNEDETYKYIFTPYYDVIDLIGKNYFFQGIPGLDLTLRKKEYIREDILPVFISERVPQENREDYYELLDEVGLTYMDPIQYLSRSTSFYSGDRLYVKDFENRNTIYLNDEVGKSNSYGIIKIILDNMAKGNTIILNNEIINGPNLFNTLSFIYEKSYKAMSDKQTEGIKIAKGNNKYQGRKPIAVDILLFQEQLERVNKGKITPKEAAKKLNISIDKYYRVKKQLQK